MKNDSFKVGDLVQLKSGGPVMTVTDDLLGMNQPEVHCKWFNGKKLESGSFPFAALRLADPQTNTAAAGK